MYLIVFFSVFVLTLEISHSAQVNPNNKDSVLEHLKFLGFIQKDDKKPLERILDIFSALKKNIL